MSGPSRAFRRLIGTERGETATMAPSGTGERATTVVADRRPVEADRPAPASARSPDPRPASAPEPAPEPSPPAPATPLSPKVSGPGIYAGGHRSGGAVGLVCGTVRTPDGWPVPDASVTVVDTAGRQVGYTVTDDRGDFDAEVSAAGRLTVVLAAAGIQPVARTATAAPGQRYELGEIELVAATRSTLPRTGSWSIDPAHSIVRATARHIGLARVEGRFTEFSGSIVLADPAEQSTVTVEIEAASITTGSDARDTHLRSPDFLDVERFPRLSYRATGIVRHSEDRATINGELTIRDVTRQVPLQVSYIGSGPDPWGGTRIAFTASAQLARRDYEISWNMGLPGGLTVIGPTLQIDLDIEAVRDGA